MFEKWILPLLRVLVPVVLVLLYLLGLAFWADVSREAGWGQNGRPEHSQLPDGP